MATAFAVLADSHRRQLLDLLRTRERSVGELVDQLGLSQPGGPKHLRLLREARLVTARHPAENAECTQPCTPAPAARRCPSSVLSPVRSSGCGAPSASQWSSAAGCRLWLTGLPSWVRCSSWEAKRGRSPNSIRRV